MKFNLNLKKVLLISIFFFTDYLHAQSIETNIQGIVIKNYRCDLSTYVEGNLVNRNAETFNGAIRVKIIDKENDILWQGAQKIIVDGQNGARFELRVLVGNCLSPNKVQITLER